MVVVSVVIPTYNRAKLLKRAINSVLSQTYTDFEILVVDDCSKYTTEELTAQYTDPRIKFIQNPSNMGANYSRNNGIRNSKGKYVAFLDDDDEWLPTKLEKQIDLLEDSRSSLGAVYSGFRLITYDHRALLRMPKHRGCLFDKLLEANIVGTTSTVVVKKSVLGEVNGFDEKLPSSQDWDLWLRIAPNYEFDFVPEILINYYVTRQSITLNPTKTVNGLFRFFVKYAQVIPEPVLKNYYLMPLGDALCLKGNMALGKKYLLYAFLNNPSNFNSFVHLALSMLGHYWFIKLYSFMSETRIAYALRQLAENTNNL